MLGRINNINLNLNSSKTDTYSSLQSKKKKLNNVKKSDGDNLSRSEALQFLLEKNWQIVEIFFSSEKKISLTFLVSEIEFKTSLDLNELSMLNEIIYHISSEKEINNEKKKLTAMMSINSSAANIPGRDIDAELKGLKLLFKRLFDLNITSVFSSEDSNVINNIYDDIIDPVYSNLGYINGFLFIFINKLTGIKINFLPEAEERNISLIRINVESLS